MDSLRFQGRLALAKKKLNINFDLKREQVKALQSVYQGKDTVCLLRTGFGKSVTYQLTPFLLNQKVPKAVTLVISPLNSIMHDQVLKLCQQGVKACYLDMRCQNGETFAFQSEADDDSCDTGIGFIYLSYIFSSIKFPSLGLIAYLRVQKRVDNLPKFYFRIQYIPVQFYI